MSANQSGKIEKLLIDVPSDFGFHVAYLAYSKLGMKIVMKAQNLN